MMTEMESQKQPSLAKLVEFHEFRNSRAKLLRPIFDFQSELRVPFLFSFLFLQSFREYLITINLTSTSNARGSTRGEC